MRMPKPWVDVAVSISIVGTQVMFVGAKNRGPKNPSKAAKVIFQRIHDPVIWLVTREFGSLSTGNVIGLYV